MLESYRKHVEERAAEGIPPLPLDAAQTERLVELIESPPSGEEELLIDLLTRAGCSRYAIPVLQGSPKVAPSGCRSPACA